MKMYRFITILLLLFNGTGALYGGWKLITDPSGASLGMSESILEHSPFRTFLIPGIVLFVMNGLLSFITLGSVLAKSRNYPLHVAAQGTLLTGWIAAQIMMLRFLFFLHFVMGGAGILLIFQGIALFFEKRKQEKQVRAKESSTGIKDRTSHA